MATKYSEQKLPVGPNRILRTQQVAEKSLEGWSIKEMAELFKVSEPTISNDLRVARKMAIDEINRTQPFQFYKLLQKSEHLEKIAYQQFYASIAAKQKKRTRVRGVKAVGSETPEQMQVVDTVLESETALTGNHNFLNIVYKQLWFQAQMLGYIKSNEIPILPGSQSNEGQTIVAMPGSNVQINNPGPGIRETTPETIEKLREIERLMSEVRSS